MNQQELENLPYPMFRTNCWEKLLLKLARKRLIKNEGHPYLCLNLPRYMFSGKLINKVSLSVDGGLEGHLCILLVSKAYYLHRHKLRVIWIDKLLAYTGE